jgi:hypothetical protein
VAVPLGDVNDEDAGDEAEERPEDRPSFGDVVELLPETMRSFGDVRRLGRDASPYLGKFYGSGVAGFEGAVGAFGDAAF